MSRVVDDSEGKIDPGRRQDGTVANQALEQLKRARSLHGVRILFTTEPGQLGFSWMVMAVQKCSSNNLIYASWGICSILFDSSIQEKEQHTTI